MLYHLYVRFLVLFHLLLELLSLLSISFTSFCSLVSQSFFSIFLKLLKLGLDSQIIEAPKTEFTVVVQMFLFDVLEHVESDWMLLSTS
jgi:hypothetical protein